LCGETAAAQQFRPNSIALCDGIRIEENIFSHDRVSDKLLSFNNGDMLYLTQRSINCGENLNPEHATTAE